MSGSADSATVSVPPLRTARLSLLGPAAGVPDLMALQPAPDRASAAASAGTAAARINVGLLGIRVPPPVPVLAPNVSCIQDTGQTIAGNVSAYVEAPRVR